MLELSPCDLAQTTWRGNKEVFDGDRLLWRTDFIIEFVTASEGFRVDITEKGHEGRYNFNYEIQGRKISFSGSFGKDWTVLEYTGNSMKLQAFLPQKQVMFLTKMY